MQVPAVETVLVAVDGSEESLEAVEFAVAIATRYGGDLAVLYVLEGSDYRAVTAGEIDPEAISAESQSFLEDVDQLADEAGVTTRSAVAYGFSTHRKLSHPGSVVLDATDELDADFIVIPREAIGLIPPDGTLAKAAEYALLYASQPVLAV